MQKLDAEATAAHIRAEWEKVRALPEMQHMYGQLQSNQYAVDLHVAAALWANTIPEGATGDQVMAAAATIAAGFIANLLMNQPEEDAHPALHYIIDQISIRAHQSLKFGDFEPGAGMVITDTGVVLKDVGDA